MKVYTLIIAVFFTVSVFGQFNVTETDIDFTISKKSSDLQWVLSLEKPLNSFTYTNLHFSINAYIDTTLLLKNEIAVMEELWGKLFEDLTINLHSVNVGYPLEYQDVLENLINAFINSEEWQAHTHKKEKKLDYPLIRKVLLEKKVYAPMEEFLAKNNYRISEIQTEKHGFLEQKDLVELGYSGDEIIPVPFIVWIIVEKTE